MIKPVVFTDGCKMVPFGIDGHAHIYRLLLELTPLDMFMYFDIKEVEGDI